jgi:hypothetical protein
MVVNREISILVGDESKPQKMRIKADCFELFAVHCAVRFEPERQKTFVDKSSFSVTHLATGRYVYVAVSKAEAMGVLNDLEACGEVVIDRTRLGDAEAIAEVQAVFQKWKAQSTDLYLHQREQLRKELGYES